MVFGAPSNEVSLGPLVTEDSKSVPVRGCEPGSPLVATVVVIGSGGVIGVIGPAAVVVVAVGFVGVIVSVKPVEDPAPLLVSVGVAVRDGVDVSVGPVVKTSEMVLPPLSVSERLLDVEVGCSPLDDISDVFVTKVVTGSARHLTTPVC